MVWIACVLLFGVKDMFWSVLRTMALFDETDGNIAIPQWTRWIGASVLGCGHLAMHRGEVLIGFNSLGHPLWVTHELLVHFAHCGTDGCNAGFIAIPQERHGLGVQSLFGDTSACTENRH